MRYSIHQLREFTSFVNNEFGSLSRWEHISLGPDYANLSHEVAQNNLIMHRISSKFQIPTAGSDSARKQLTLDEVFAYDAEGLTTFEPALMCLPPHVRKALYEVRHVCDTVLRDYRFDVGSCQITTGESYISASGDTSILAKLRDQAQWCVTPDCFDLFAAVAYRNRFLRNRVKQFYKNRDWEHKKLFITMSMFHMDGEPDAIKKKASKYFDKRRQIAYRKLWLEQKDSIHDDRNIGFHCFKAQLKQVVTFVGGARFTTVPKNNERDRVIECEAMCNMIVQRVIAHGISNLIHKHFGIDLTIAQDVHRMLIANPELSTIDLKNASNSVWTVVLEWLFGKSKLLNHIKASRSGTVFCGEGAYQLNMVAPMGNGFTFECMTLLLLLITRHYDKNSRVFGDDIIVKGDTAQRVIEALNAIGFKTNESKTFIHGNFRESCGAFISENSYLTSYECRHASNISDAIVLTNKLRILKEYATGSTKVSLTNAYHRICEVAPIPCLQGCSENTSVLEGAIIVPIRYLKGLHKQDVNYLKLLKSVDSEALKIENELQYKKHKLSFGYRFSVASTPYSRIPTDVKQNHWFYFYLMSGVSSPKVKKDVLVRETVLYTGEQNFITLLREQVGTC